MPQTLSPIEKKLRRFLYELSRYKLDTDGLDPEQDEDKIDDIKADRDEEYLSSCTSDLHDFVQEARLIVGDIKRRQAKIGKKTKKSQRKAAAGKRKN